MFCSAFNQVEVTGQQCGPEHPLSGAVIKVLQGRKMEDVDSPQRDIPTICCFPPHKHPNLDFSTTPEKSNEFYFLMNLFHFSPQGRIIQFHPRRIIRLTLFRLSVCQGVKNVTVDSVRCDSHLHNTFIKLSITQRFAGGSEALYCYCFLFY